jgi:hypothetical protein
MTAFWLVVVIGIALFIFSNMRNSHKQDVFDLCKPIVNAWIAEKNGVLDSVMAATYRDDQLAVHPGAYIFVGQFDRREGNACGFYLEILGGEVAIGRLFLPSGITSWHKNLSMQAKSSQSTLLQMLEIAEEQHHKKNPNWKDAN